jgi:hypothetical protein
MAAVRTMSTAPSATRRSSIGRSLACWREATVSNAETTAARRAAFDKDPPRKAPREELDVEQLG